MRGAGVEESGRGVCEISLRHQVVCLDDPVNIGAMDTNCDTHNHVLWPFRHSTVDAKKVRTLEGLETEAVRR